MNEKQKAEQAELKRNVMSLVDRHLTELTDELGLLDGRNGVSLLPTALGYMVSTTLNRFDSIPDEKRKEWRQLFETLFNDAAWYSNFYLTERDEPVDQDT